MSSLSNQTSLPYNLEQNEVVFIDANVSDYQSLIVGVKLGIEVVILDSTQDGVAQITEVLQNAHYQFVHIVSHGSPGCLYLGNSQLSLTTLDKYTEQLQQWFINKNQNSLLLYGCNVAAYDAGEEFIQKLHELTKVNIAASTTKTGNASLGGNWSLESTLGKITPALAFKKEVLETYSFVLPSSNDNFANRIILTGNSGTSTGNNVGATNQFGEPIQSGATNSIWWSWTAPISGVVTFDTIGSNFDTYLSVHTGNFITSLSPVTSSDDISGEITSRVSFNATAGTTYHISVDGYGSSTGDVTLNYSFSAGTTVGSNVAPTLTDTVLVLNSVQEDAGAPSGAVGTLVSSLVGLGRNVTDPNSAAVTGIAITNTNTTNGTWWYTTDNGTTWNSFSAVSTTFARLLAADAKTRIYFQPNTNFSGTISNAITFRAWDQTLGTSGYVASVNTNGGTSAYSSTTDAASITVNSVNDAPVITPPSVISVPQNASNGTVLATITATDADVNTTLSNWAISSGNIDIDGDGNAAISINSNTGQIAINDIDDFNAQTNPKINLQVNVSDGITKSANERVTLSLALSAGDLDPTFGNNGAVSTTSTLYARSVVIQPDGKIVVAGGFTAFDLARYNIDGSLDASFGNAGKISSDIGVGSENGNGVALQSDGKIVVTGYIWDTSRSSDVPDFALARYNSDGTLDSSFGSGGKVITNFGEDFGRNVIVQADGKIILAGYIGNGSRDYVLVRYNPNGSLDTSFGNSGKVNGTGGYVVALQSDGKILVAGSAASSSFSDFAITRYNNNGTLDTSFGNAGRVLAPIGTSGEEISSIAIQPDGKIVVAGRVWKYVNGTSSDQDDLAVARFNIDGSLDASFGNGGKVITPVHATNSDRATGLTIQPNGKIIVAGYFEKQPNSQRTSVLVAYNADGTLDSTFGIGGQVITPLMSHYDENTVVATQSDGKIVLVGKSTSSSNFTVARYIGTSNEIVSTKSNIAPTLADTFVTLTPIKQYANAPSGAVGNLVSSLVSLNTNVTDFNSGAVTGIAITTANTANGTLWYSTDNGTNWNLLGQVSNTNARLLAADTNTRLYFQPNSNFSGNINNAIVFRAWDQTSGINGGTADTSVSGGATAFSNTTDIASIQVTPTLTVSLLTTDATAAEATPTINTGVYNITRNQTEGALTVTLAIDANSTASASDYNFSINTGTVSVSGSTVTVVIPNGVAGVNLTLTPVDDTLMETEETLKLNLATNSTYVVSGTANTGTVIIEASDPNTPPVVINDTYALAEGSVLETIGSVVTSLTSLLMNSESGNYVGQGKSYSFNSATGTFGISRAYPTNPSSNNAIRVSYSDSASVSKWWDLSFMAPSNSPFVAGTTYTNATRFPFQNYSVAGLDVSGEGRGNNTLTGLFTINQIIYGSGDAILSFDANFDQRGTSDTGLLRGRIQYNAAPDNQRPGVLINDTDAQTTHLTASLVTGPANGTLVFNSNGSFRYTPNQGFTGLDSFTYRASDGIAQSSVATVSLNVVALNKAPVNIIPGVQSIQEDASIIFSAANSNRIAISDADAGSNPLSVTLRTSNGSLTLSNVLGLNFSTGNGIGNSTMTFTGTVDSINTALNGLRFNPTSNFNGTASIQLITNDQGYSNAGGALSDTDTININVISVNDNPVIDFPVGTPVYIENGSAVAINNNASVFDVDSLDFDKGKLTVNFSANGTANDRLGIRNQGSANGQIGRIGTDVTYQGIVIGTFTGGTATTPLEVTFNTNANQAAVTALLRNITYENLSENPSIIPPQVRFVLTDGDGGTSNSFNTSVNVIAVNDAPVLNKTILPILNAINEDVSNANNLGTKISDLVNGLITDVDGDQKAIAVTGVDNTNGKWQYSIDGGLNWRDFGTVSGNSAVLLGGTPLLYNSRLAGPPASQNWLSFTNLSGASETVGGNSVTLNTTANNGIYAGYSNYTPARTLVNPNFPILNRNTGYSLSFNLRQFSESRTNQNRAGFSVIAISSDGIKGIELGFQILSSTSGKIFAQGDGITPNPSGQTNGMFLAAEEVSFNTNGFLNDAGTDYTLSVLGDNYTLSANGTQILTGLLRDYRAFSGSIDPYETPNFIFLGDNTTSASGVFNLKQVALQTDSRVRFTPNANYNGTSDITFRAWDTTNRIANGTTNVNTLINGATTAFSTETVKATITVNSVNDAPTLDITGILNLDAINEDAISNNGTLIADFMGKRILDLDTGALKGVAVTGADNSNGTWQYTIDGSNWNNLNVSATSATLLRDTARIRFLAKPDFYGTVSNGVTFRAWDASDGRASGATGINPGVGGGTSAFSTDAITVGITVNAINDAPTFNIGADQSIKAGSEQQTIAGWASGFNPGANEATQTIQQYIIEVISNPNIFAANGTPTITKEGNLIYTPVNTITTSATAEIRVRVQDNGGTANGGLDTSAFQSFKITVNNTANNFVDGAANADIIRGTDGIDRIDGKGGNDIIFGGLGDDRIFGAAGDDTLYGDLGITPNNNLDVQPTYNIGLNNIDIISGGLGNDNIYGNLGDDKLYGDDGNDSIWGGSGNDSIWGGSGNDSIWGGAGNDTIWGGLGNDTLNGGTGRDTFVLSNGQGIDAIVDFKLGEDVLGCAGGLRYESLLFTQLGKDTLIRDKVTNQDIALLQGITASRLTSSNFTMF